jgi:hypothetical protein
MVCVGPLEDVREAAHIREGLDGCVTFGDARAVAERFPVALAGLLEDFTSDQPDLGGVVSRDYLDAHWSGDSELFAVDVLSSEELDALEERVGAVFSESMTGAAYLIPGGEVAQVGALLTQWGYRCTRDDALWARVDWNDWVPGA